jgi:hypothetical protein
MSLQAVFKTSPLAQGLPRPDSDDAERSLVDGLAEATTITHSLAARALADLEALLLEPQPPYYYQDGRLKHTTIYSRLYKWHPVIWAVSDEEIAAAWNAADYLMLDTCMRSISEVCPGGMSNCHYRYCLQWRCRRLHSGRRAPGASPITSSQRSNGRASFVC